MEYYYLCKLLKHLIAKFIYRGKEGYSSGEEKRIVGFNKSQVSLKGLSSIILCDHQRIISSTVNTDCLKAASAAVAYVLW